MTNEDRVAVQLMIWRGLDEPLRVELLETVWNVLPRNPELAPLYSIAADMIARSLDQVIAAGEQPTR